MSDLREDAEQTNLIDHEDVFDNSDGPLHLGDDKTKKIVGCGPRAPYGLSTASTTASELLSDVQLVEIKPITSTFLATEVPLRPRGLAYEYDDDDKLADCKHCACPLQ
eukprot:TRINITY_DN51487_c0_g1_i1.p1 TRINITY_DN51487_c0_g1~~TRINITY_DN51487_c0_g1_i1.p1  ORF type:complete len:108 (-),score=13.23 TRINITY_DN51487_c0_g1_i1:79-402(-)